MKELWVKKTVWRRYLIKDEDLKAATLALTFEKNGCELVGDCYDINDVVEYDNEEVILPVEFEVKDN